MLLQYTYLNMSSKIHVTYVIYMSADVLSECQKEAHSKASHWCIWHHFYIPLLGKMQLYMAVGQN